MSNHENELVPDTRGRLCAGEGRRTPAGEREENAGRGEGENAGQGRGGHFKVGVPKGGFRWGPRTMEGPKFDVLLTSHPNFLSLSGGLLVEFGLCYEVAGPSKVGRSELELQIYLIKIIFQI